MTVTKSCAGRKRPALTAIVTVGTNLRDCRKAVAIAAQYEFVYAALGIHPHDVKGIDEKTYDAISKLVSQPKVVAYGEIGLDFFRNRSPRDVQIRCFGEQLEMADEFDLPVIIHDREAHAETLKMLTGLEREKRRHHSLFFRRRRHGEKVSRYGLLHFHSGTGDLSQSRKNCSKWSGRFPWSGCSWKPTRPI